MLPFLTAQVLIACYAYLIANKEAAYINERRYYVPVNSPFDDPFHTNGALSRGVVLILCSLFQTSIAGYILTPFVCGLILWVVYDALIGEEVYENPYYLGTTSKVDAFLVKTFGKKAGKRKVQVAGVLVVLLNLLYLFL
jgi:hypothetical protein